jgi:chromosome segregation ATPase
MQRLLVKLAALDSRIATTQSRIDELTRRRQFTRDQLAEARASIKSLSPQVKPARRQQRATAKALVARDAQLVASQQSHVAALAERDLAAQRLAAAQAHLQGMDAQWRVAASEESRLRQEVTKARNGTPTELDAAVGWQMSAVAARLAHARVGLADETATSLTLGLQAAEAALAAAAAGLQQAQAEQSAAAVAAQQAAAHRTQVRDGLAQSRAAVRTLKGEPAKIRKSLRKAKSSMRKLTAKRAKLEARVTRLARSLGVDRTGVAG